MNIIDLISRNLFLNKLFPEGLAGDILLGKLSFTQGRMELSIHTQQKPAVEVEKWGMWGTDYNVIALELLGNAGKYVHIENWWHADFAPVNLIKENGISMLTQRGDNWSVKIDVDNLIFQRSSTYII